MKRCVLAESACITPRLDNDTHWNTSFTMTPRILELRGHVKAFVDKKVLDGEIVARIVDNAMFWDALERVLKPLAEWQDIAQADHTTLADLFYEYTQGKGRLARDRAAAIDQQHPGLGNAV